MADQLQLSSPVSRPVSAVSSSRAWRPSFEELHQALAEVHEREVQLAAEGKWKGKSPKSIVSPGKFKGGNSEKMHRVEGEIRDLREQVALLTSKFHVISQERNSAPYRDVKPPPKTTAPAIPQTLPNAIPDEEVQENRRHSLHSLYSVIESQEAMMMAGVGSELGSKMAYVDADEDADPKKVTWKDRLITNILDKYSLASKVHEPERTGCFASIIISSKFNLLSALVILLNSIVTCLQSNEEMATLELQTGAAYTYIDLAFTSFYTLELMSKMIVHRLFFFWNEDMIWNITDTVLVAQGLFEVLSSLLFNTQGPQLTFARLLRLLKLGKALRLFRMVKFLKDLRNMLSLILSSFLSLFWSFALLALVLFMFSLLFVQLQAGFLMELKEQGLLEESHRENVMKKFGSIGQGMLSLYMAVTGGMDWIEVFTPLSKEGSASVAATVFFIGFWHFSMLNVVTGIVMEKAVQNSQPDRDDQMKEQRKNEERLGMELTKIFRRMDLDRNGMLNLAEFVNCLKDENVRHYLGSLGLSIQDARTFFKTMNTISGQSEVKIEDFVGHCLSLKGYATAVELAQLSFEVKTLRRELRR
eukprot:TRINITY_DN83158_c0_g1_i1.p1 TRINITY_DN83158_c0_g1~~TRINITY_DN83158_c0_g1_i1.p1  ORF type:complete len:587 (-),score=103.08 TRINITY_DN83158_c0_g1_i1:90-1850(-)